jgi:hypothetical protein
MYLKKRSSDSGWISLKGAGVQMAGCLYTGICLGTLTMIAAKIKLYRIFDNSGKRRKQEKDGKNETL